MKNLYAITEAILANVQSLEKGDVEKTIAAEITNGYGKIIAANKVQLGYLSERNKHPTSKTIPFLEAGLHEQPAND